LFPTFRFVLVQAALSSLEDYPRLSHRNRRVIEDAAKKLRESVSKTKP